MNIESSASSPTAFSAISRFYCLALWLAVQCACTPSHKAQAEDILESERHYEHGPDSLRQPGVPEGTLTEHIWTDSEVYPGTVRYYSVYVPNQYDPQTPAALMVVQDGHVFLSEDGEYRAPIVLDNLIHEGSIPVLIAVFIDPGYVTDAVPEKRGWDRTLTSNRAVEYCSLGPDYANFLLSEILPQVEQSYNISKDPARRAVCGSSHGGIASFTVAWERPDQFQKVLSNIGSFVDIRGGHRYPEIIAASPQKPLRIFLQDGRYNNRKWDKPNMNWVSGNLRLAAALDDKQYDYRYVLGDGGHNNNHGGVIFPDALRWLWRDHAE